MENRYTAAQWAQISGGHTLDDDAPTGFGFVKDLNESRMYRTRQQAQNADMRDVLDFAFLNIITLWILYNDYNNAPFAKRYAAETYKYRNFDVYRQSSTDLYVALNQIKTGASSSSKEAIQRSKVNLPEDKLRQFFISLSSGNNFPGVNAMLLQLERSLDIQNSNYRSVRRIAAGWTSATSSQKKLAVTRLLQYYRANAFKSELYLPLKKYAASNSMELSGVQDAEKKKGLSTASKIAIGAAGGYFIGRQLGKKLASH
jgi:hypothetical protein